jgi:hypothetical protein
VVRGLLLKVIAAPEPFNAALGIHYPLFAGVEGVAIAANFNPHGGLGGPGMEHVAAGAGHHCVEELRVSFSFHFSPSISLNLEISEFSFQARNRM